MSFGPISNLTSSYLQSIFGSVLKTAGLSTTNAASTGQTPAIQPSDGGQLSPFAQILSSLQQLQQSNPTQYQQVTEQIATNLQSAAKTAQSEGNTTAANQLNRLANDFTTTSQNGQLPNVQDLAQAASAHHHHHHHFHASSSDGSSSSSNSGANTTTGTTSDSGLSQLLSAFQANTDQNQALNPLAIIANTLASANNTPSNS